MMRAIEFEAVIKNGLIKVPEKYKDWFGKPVRVILLTEEEEEKAPTNYIEELFGTVPDFEPLSREAVHERN